MSIDEQSIIPKYYQLKELLIQHIRQNDLQPGSLLPSENELIGIYQVSRNTVRQAFSSLESDGLVYKIRGKGTFYKGETSAAEARSNLIGVITPVTYESIYLDIINGIESHAHDRKFQIVLSNSMANPQKEREVLEAMLKTGIDGLIIEPALSGRIRPDSYIFRTLYTIPIPVVVIDCCIEDLRRPCLTLDDEEYGYRAARHLIDMGHRRIAYVYKNGVLAAELRGQGYERALAEANILKDENLVAGFEESEDRRGSKPSAKITARLMESEEPPTAIFYFNDEYAVDGIHALRDAGIDVPGDVSVIGVDDSYYATVAGMSLTTLAHPKKDMGTRAAELLIDEIENPGTSATGCTLIEPTLVVRDTVSPTKGTVPSSGD